MLFIVIPMLLLVSEVKERRFLIYCDGTGIKIDHFIKARSTKVNKIIQILVKTLISV